MEKVFSWILGIIIIIAIGFGIFGFTKSQLQKKDAQKLDSKLASISKTTLPEKNYKSVVNNWAKAAEQARKLKKEDLNFPKSLDFLNEEWQNYLTQTQDADDEIKSLSYFETSLSQMRIEKTTSCEQAKTELANLQTRVGKIYNTTPDFRLGPEYDKAIASTKAEFLKYFKAIKQANSNIKSCKSINLDITSLVKSYNQLQEMLKQSLKQSLSTRADIENDIGKIEKQVFAF